MATIIIRDVPKQAHLKIKQLAKDSGVSMNQYLITILNNLALTNEFINMERKYRNLVNQLVERLDINGQILKEVNETNKQLKILLEEVFIDGETDIDEE